MQYWRINRIIKRPIFRAQRGIAMLEAAAAAVLLMILFCGGIAVCDFLYKGADLSEIVDQHLYDNGTRVFRARTDFNHVILELDRQKLNTILLERFNAIEHEILLGIFKVENPEQISNGQVALNLYRIEVLIAQINFDPSNGTAQSISVLDSHSSGSYQPAAEQLERTNLREALSKMAEVGATHASTLAIPTGAWGDQRAQDRYLDKIVVLAARAFVSLDNSPGGWFWRYFEGSQGVSTLKIVPFRGDIDA